MDFTMNNQTLISTKEPAPSEEVRNWLELPHDVLSHIFLKLGSVCPAWRKISKEPTLFRSIDMGSRWDLLDEYLVEKITREAVDRSCGQLVEFSMDSSGSNELLAYIADKSAELRCFRLVNSHELRVDALINMAKKAVMLEELEICHCSFLGDKIDMLKTVGNACPLIKSFRLNSQGCRYPHQKSDDEALAIAENMPQLRRLHLFGNNLTNLGLKAILDSCLHLESLDLRQCFNIELKGDLLMSCRDRHIQLRFPNDSTDDYEFDATIDEGSYDATTDERSYEFSEHIYFPGSDSDDDESGYNPLLDFCYYDPDLIYDREAPFDPDYYV
ncbi:hypothetical protein MKW94_011021 [Papaver nudicaule]|uniref:F-box domain-containing protein n=1 Tax=Papaver nudicaule TaxID=74823 RepID=A0AA42B226_PAPNU|nr:hypothetical protein [Papaver nudicaule]